jgi:preprotein translocase subunit SecF
LAERLQQRKINQGGSGGSFDQLSGVEGVTPQVTGGAGRRSGGWPVHRSAGGDCGPKVGADLRRQAMLATLYALGGMLVYIAFRFEWIYGVAAVVAVAHDVVITVGSFHC